MRNNKFLIVRVNKRNQYMLLICECVHTTYKLCHLPLSERSYWSAVKERLNLQKPTLSRIKPFHQHATTPGSSQKLWQRKSIRDIVLLHNITPLSCCLLNSLHIQSLLIKVYHRDRKERLPFKAIACTRQTVVLATVIFSFLLSLFWMGK